MGAAAWGTQFHPEVLRELGAAWARSAAADLTAVGLTVDGVTTGIATSEPELRRVWGDFTARWVQVVAARAT